MERTKESQDLEDEIEGSDPVWTERKQTENSACESVTKSSNIPVLRAPEGDTERVGLKERKSVRLWQKVQTWVFKKLSEAQRA